MCLHEYIITHNNHDMQAIWAGEGEGCVFDTCYLCQPSCITMGIKETHLCQFLALFPPHRPVMCDVSLQHRAQSHTHSHTLLSGLGPNEEMCH